MRNAEKRGVMKAAALLGLPEGMEIDQIQITETGLVVSVVSTDPQSCCPLCSQPSSHVHSYYHRILKDAPFEHPHLPPFCPCRRSIYRMAQLSTLVLSAEIQ